MMSPKTLATSVLFVLVLAAIAACRHEEPVAVAVPTPQAKPYGWLDEPAAGTVDRRVKVRGWALDDEGEVRRIEILINGIPQPVDIRRENREGVCVKYPGRPGCPDVGYVGELDLRERNPGTYTISVRFTNDAGVANEVARREISVE